MDKALIITSLGTPNGKAKSTLNRRGTSKSPQIHPTRHHTTTTEVDVRVQILFIQACANQCLSTLAEVLSQHVQSHSYGERGHGRHDPPVPCHLKDLGQLYDKAVLDLGVPQSAQEDSDEDAHAPLFKIYDGEPAQKAQEHLHQYASVAKRLFQALITHFFGQLHEKTFLKAIQDVRVTLLDTIDTLS